MIEFLKNIDFELHDVIIEVWGSRETLALIRECSQIIKCTHPWLNKGILYRSLWQKYVLSKIAVINNCDIIFAPGGTYTGNYEPAVTMSRNMLPFENEEVQRYFPSLFFFKLLLLRFFQLKSFRCVNGLIFLSDYAENVIKDKYGVSVLSTKIPHGLDRRFKQKISHSRFSRRTSRSEKIQLIYVSTVDKYKHQEKVVEAVAHVRQKTGLSVELVMIGSSYPPSLKMLNKALIKYDPFKQWAFYKGPCAFDDLPQNIIC